MMRITRFLALAATILVVRASSAQEPARKGSENLESADGRRIPGRLMGEAASGFRFVPIGDRPAVPIGPGAHIAFESPPIAAPAAAPPPFLVLLGGGQRLSGRLLELSADAIRLDQGSGLRPSVISRAGALALIQRPGEASVLLEGFDAIDAGRWSVTGDPDVADEIAGPGGRSLRLPASGASVTTHLAEPVASGRLEISYFDPGTRFAGRRQFVDLSFRAPSGDLSTVRAVLGWAEETLGVESPGGPTLAVQPLARKAGWHRLAVRFAADRLDLAVDRLELAHGDGPSGALTEIRLATEVLDGADPAATLTARFDDLQLSRLAAPSGRLEIDPSQDEVRLVTGDQVFGKILAADGRRVDVRVDDRATSLPWSEVSGLFFRRVPAIGATIDGLLVRVEWRASASVDPLDLETIDGALISANEREFLVETPFAGTLAIPRDRVFRLDVMGRGTRIVLESKPHHLGDRSVDDLDPPQPEGDVLNIPFSLDRVPAGPIRLVVDVVQVVSALGNPEQRVNPGELSTRILVNDREIDVLNRHVSARNETPERVSIDIPAGLLRPGRNVVGFRQDGTKDEPAKRDNLGLLSVALESPSPAPTGSGIAKP